MSEPVIRARGLRKIFTQGPFEVPVLLGIDLDIGKGESLAIVGASGSGKSTLLHLLGGLDAPTSGEVLIQGRDISKVKEVEKSRIRNQALGFVYQFHHLLAEFSAQENVAMPLLVRRMPEEEAREQAADMLGGVGLSHRLTHRPGELSGGERQRAALARGLVTRPACLLADEPTGNLDRHTGEAIHQLFLELNRERGSTLLVVTHNPDLAALMPRRLRMVDGGRLLEESDLPSASTPGMPKTDDAAAAAGKGAAS